MNVIGKRQAVAAVYEIVEAGRNLRAEAALPTNQKANEQLKKLGGQF